MSGISVDFIFIQDCYWDVVFLFIKAVYVADWLQLFVLLYILEQQHFFAKLCYVEYK